MNVRERKDKFLALFKDAEAIFDSGVSWETKYDLIFDDLSGAMNELIKIRYTRKIGSDSRECVESWFKLAKIKADELMSIRFEGELIREAINDYDDYADYADFTI